MRFMQKKKKKMFVMPIQQKSNKLYVMNAILRNTYNFFYNLHVHVCVNSEWCAEGKEDQCVSTTRERRE